MSQPQTTTFILMKGPAGIVSIVESDPNSKDYQDHKRLGYVRRGTKTYPNHASAAPDFFRLKNGESIE